MNKVSLEPINLTSFLGNIDIPPYVYNLAHSITLHKLHDRQIPNELVVDARSNSHSKLIDYIVEFFITHEKSNVLSFAYLDGNFMSNTSNRWVSPGNSFTVQLLKSPAFQLIHTKLGDKQFLSVLYNYEAFSKENGIKLWGPVILHEFSNKHFNRPQISSIKMMYKEKGHGQIRDPFPPDVRSCLVEIFKDAIPSKKPYPRRFRKIASLLKICLLNHQHYKFEYPYILDSICPLIEMKDDYLKLATSKKLVSKFILIILAKVLPIELIGSLHNSSILSSRVVQFINVSLNERLALTDFVKGFRINDIEWTKPISNKKLTKSEFCKAQRMFQCYIKWLFQYIIAKLLGCFFHVTEASQSNQIFFYRHETWNSVSSKFLRSYFDKNLVLLKNSSDSLASFSDNGTYMGIMKLLPKPHDFRVIAVPFKGSQEEKFTYINFQKKKVKPINQVLRTLRTNKCIIVSSVSDLALNISNYKNAVTSNFGFLPSIHALKFDVKHAYDSLPINLVKTVLKKRLDEKYHDQMILVSDYSKLVDNHISVKRRKVVSKLNNQFTSTSSSKGIIIQKDPPVVLSKDDVIQFVDEQLTRTSILYHGKVFVRKVGVFQGFPLSGTLFDIVYDVAVEKLLDRIPRIERSNTRIFRLVDDFLVLSTSRGVVKNLEKFISRPLELFNMRINRLKTLITSSKLTFVGLSIKLEDLSLIKNRDTYNMTSLNLSSFERLYHRLTFIMISYLNSYLLNVSCNTRLAVAQNVKNIIYAITLRFIKSYKLIRLKQKWVKDPFRKFIHQQIQFIDSKVHLDKIGLSRSKLMNIIYSLLCKYRVTTIT